jgi:hypothetical protein
MEKSLIKKTIIKEAGLIFFLFAISLGWLLLAVHLIEDAELALFVGGILIFITLIVTFGFIVPKLFKEYIEVYWKEKEMKEKEREILAEETCN